MSDVPQIKVAEPEPSDENPWLDDKLGRKDCASKLTAVIQGQIAPMTISVNGEWGSGKTFMLKRWQKQLEKDGYTAIYFNAWEDDCLTDPLVAILGQLYKDLNKGTLKNVCEAVKKATGPFLKRVGLSVLNKGVEHLTGVDAAGIIAEELKTAQESILDNYVAMTESRTALKEALQNLANKNFEEKKTPLVFIVDELDRCRPTFAIEVLERIKHLFNIDHVVFVLGIDRKNLGKSIQSVYGDIDVENYLHRFFDFDFLLPPAPHKIFGQVIWSRYLIPERLAALANQKGDESYIRWGEGFRKEAIFLFERHDLSLREIEQGIKIFSLFLKSIAVKNGFITGLFPSLLVLKLKNAYLYRQYVDSKCSIIDVIDFLFKSPVPDGEDFAINSLPIILATVSKTDPCFKAVETLMSRHQEYPKTCPDELLKSQYIKRLPELEFFTIVDQLKAFGKRNNLYDHDVVQLVNEQLNLFSFRPSL